MVKHHPGWSAGRWLSPGVQPAAVHTGSAGYRLTLNEDKPSLRNARQERFDFLGYSFGPHRYKANGKRYLGASPSKKSVQRLKTTVGNLLVPGNNEPWPPSWRYDLTRTSGRGRRQ